MKQLHNLLFIILLPFMVHGGNYGDDFLLIGSTPQTVSLGQAVVALPRLPGGYLMNPSAIGGINTTSVFFMAADQFSLANFYSIGLTKPLKRNWSGAVNLLSLSIDNIPVKPDLRGIFSIVERRDLIREISSSPYKTFDDRETSLIFSFTRANNFELDLGWQFEKIALFVPMGINVKAIHKKFYNLEGFGIGVDLGSMINFKVPDVAGPDWLGEMTFGLAIRDIFGTILYWNTQHRDKIPQDLVLGVSYKQEFSGLPVNVLVTTQTSSRFPDSNRLGIEITILDKVALRLGNDLGQLKGGMGITVPVRGKSLSLDYSFFDHELGQNHQLGVRFDF